MRGEVADQVKQTIRETIAPDPAMVIEGSTHLKGQLGADSLDRITLAQELEQLFGVEINDSQMGSWQTVSDVIRTVEDKVRVSLCR